MRLHLKKCGKTWVDSRWRRGRGGHGRVAGPVVRNRNALAAAACELAVQFVDALEKARCILLGVALPKAHASQLGDALKKARNHGRPVGRRRLEIMRNRIKYDVRSRVMNSIAKMFFSKREQHHVGRRRRNENRRVLRDHDVAVEFDAGVNNCSERLLASTNKGNPM